MEQNEEECIREYANGGHVPGIPGFFPIGVKVRIDERTNTVVPDAQPPALPVEETPVEQAAPVENQSSEQGEALPVESASIQSNSLIDAFGMLGGNS